MKILEEKAQEQRELKQRPEFLPVVCNSCGADCPDFRYQLNSSAIVTCNKCQLSYVNPRASSSWLQNKLQQWANIDVVDQERLRIAFDPGTMALYQRYLSWLHSYGSSPSNARMLDIGCSVGAFLVQGRRNGYRVKGLEVGTASARYAREAHSLNISAGSLYDHDFPAASFDIISMLEVIEHLEDPRGCLERIHEWLRPQGALLLTTPNFNSLYRRLFGSRWWVINCEDEHIYFFTMETLTHLLQDTGYQVRFVYTRGFDIAGMIKLTCRSGNKKPDNNHDLEVNGDYFEARNDKEKIKNLLNRLGILSVARKTLGALDWLASQRWSPLFGLGEQLIIIATRKDQEI